MVTTIREQVLNGKSKSQIARDFNMPYQSVWTITKDIRIKIVKQKILIDKVRDEIRNGKSKYQAAKDHNLRKSTVYMWTNDIPSKTCVWPGIRGKTLDMVQEIMTKGFFVPAGANVHQQFLTLRKYFPSIYRITFYGRQIFLLEGKEDAAVRAFLENTRKKIIGYHELRNVTKVFRVDLSKKEKEAFLFKKRCAGKSKYRVVKNEGSLRENDDSFSFFLHSEELVQWFFLSQWPPTD